MTDDLEIRIIEIPKAKRIIKKEAEKIKKEGRKEGRKEGIKSEKIKIAKAMIIENIPINTIIKITGLTKEEIEHIEE